VLRDAVFARQEDQGLHENDFITAAKIDRLAPKG
jgi:hypothetical protein